MSETIIKHVLTFPEGTFLITKEDALYFMRFNTAEAYSCWGEERTLFGKYARIIEDREDPTAPKYTLTYEIEDGDLIAARLITKDKTSKGSLAPAETTAEFNQALQTGDLTLVRPKSRPYICRVAKIDDQNDLILIDSSDDRPRHTIYIGKPGNYTKLQPESYVQGGNSFYFQDIGNGKPLKLPYGIGRPRPDEAPTYDGQHIYYQKIEDRYDFAKYGLTAPEHPLHLGPFTPKQVSAKPAPRVKPPSR